MKVKLILIILTLLVSKTAMAGLITYTDRNQFELALSSSTLHDFNNLSQSSIFLGTPSFSFGDATYTNTGGVWQTLGGFGALTNQVGDQNNADTLITLSSGYNALGLDLGLLMSPGTIFVELKNTLGATVFSGPLAVTENDLLGTQSSTFYGFILDDSNIFSLKLAAGGFPTTDNLIYGVSEQSSSVPEPSTFAMFLLGIVGVVSRKFNNKR